MTTNDNKCIENEFSTWSHSPVCAQLGPCDVKIDIPAVKWNSSDTKLLYKKTVMNLWHVNIRHQTLRRK